MTAQALGDEAAAGDVIRELRARVAALEAENKALREQLAAMKPAISDEPTAADSKSEPAPLALEKELAQAKARVQSLESEKAELEQIAGVTSKGELLETQKTLIKSRYDEKADLTTVEGTPMPVASANTAGFVEHLVTAAFEFAGTELTEQPESFQLVLYTKANPNRRYRNFKAATLLIDGEAVQVPVVSYQTLDTLGGAKQTAGRSGVGKVEARDERLTLAIEPALAERIGAAHTLAVHFTGIDLKLGRDHIAMMEGVRRRAGLMLDSQASP